MKIEITIPDELVEQTIKGLKKQLGTLLKAGEFEERKELAKLEGEAFVNKLFETLVFSAAKMGDPDRLKKMQEAQKKKAEADDEFEKKFEALKNK